ncbi:hypothetical protein F0L17_14615 [Streptomyces sp. TRM43335]|uniref:Uncharacterized protein n=1 Tax=Streptomyces taklimakanensis TaxID=2569853 RepID=A0A6G2BDI5_9ACTN|nr:hypothetical protein [Streptomyces taklimakanensis]MTE20318.1 hypothetical protein [Streptomyces taklimakanensis]
MDTAPAEHVWEDARENRKRCTGCGLVAVRHLVGGGPRWWVEWIRDGRTWSQLDGEQAPACTPAPREGNRPVDAAVRPVVVPYTCSAGSPRCGKKARLFPCGWRCHDHRPGRPREDE